MEELKLNSLKEQIFTALKEHSSRECPAGQTSEASHTISREGRNIARSLNSELKRHGLENAERVQSDPEVKHIYYHAADGIPPAPGTV